MPHLRIRGMKKDEVIDISSNLLDKISTTINCPKDHITLEYIPSIYILDGVEGQGNYPFVEMLWFERNDEAMKLVANIITDLIKVYKYNDVAVYFTNLKKDQYFENGEHF